MIYTIPATATHTGKSYTVEAEEVAPGLLVHREVDPPPGTPDDDMLYVVTHAASGLAIRDRLLSDEEARALVAELVATGLDFTLPADALRAAATGMVLPWRSEPYDGPSATEDHA